jgi:hypothetical protein
MFFYFRLLLKEIFSELDEIKNQSSYLSDMFTESEGETKYGNKEATPGGGVAPPLAVLPHGVGPSGVNRPRPSAYKFTSSGKP